MGKIVGIAMAMIVLFCLAGIQMGNSRNSALRHTAVLAAMKKTFLVQYRDVLVLWMIENNIPAKRHSMDNYLNCMFYGLFHPTLAGYRY